MEKSYKLSKKWINKIDNKIQTIQSVKYNNLMEL